MKNSIKQFKTVSILLLLSCAAILLPAQTPATAKGASGAGPALRIKDSVSCWILRRGEGSGEPGRWFHAALAQCQSARADPPAVRPVLSAAIAPTSSRPTIRAGDRVLLEGHFHSADLYLNAEALGPANAGDGFWARLAVGSAVLRAIAQSPGHAVVK